MCLIPAEGPEAGPPSRTATSGSALGRPPRKGRSLPVGEALGATGGTLLPAQDARLFLRLTWPSPVVVHGDGRLAGFWLPGPSWLGLLEQPREGLTPGYLVLLGWRPARQILPVDRVSARTWRGVWHAGAQPTASADLSGVSVCGANCRPLPHPYCLGPESAPLRSSRARRAPPPPRRRLTGFHGVAGQPMLWSGWGSGWNV